MVGSLFIAMDIETSDAIDSLRADILRVDLSVRSVESTLRVEIQRVETSLGQRIDGLGDSVDGLGERVDSLGERVDGLGERVDGLGEKVDGVRTHADVLFESLRDDIRMVAEGIVSLSAKVDTLKPPGSR
jgi:uncharacterized protein YoxC